MSDYPRLGDTQEKTSATKYTFGRYLQLLAQAKNSPSEALEILKGSRATWGWSDQGHLTAALEKAAVSGMSTSDMAYQTLSDSLLDAMRSISIPLALMPFMNVVPRQTRIYINNSGEIATEVAESASTPVLKGDWSTLLMTPKKFAAISVQTLELMRSDSPKAAMAITNDISQAMGERENYGFVSPYVSGSVLNGASHFTCSGSALSNIDADLKQLIGSVLFVSRKGCCFLMTEGTATYLSLVRGSGGNLAYPNISPAGGFLCGLPVLITRACSDEYSPAGQVIAIVNPSQIFWGDEGGINLTTSTNAALQQTDAPSGASTQVSMFQTDSVAIKCVKFSSWFVKTGCSAYMVTTY